MFDMLTSGAAIPVVPARIFNRAVGSGRHAGDDRTLRRNDALPQDDHDEEGEQHPDAVGDGDQEELLHRAVAFAVGAATSHLGEAVKVEERLPERHDGDGEGKRNGVAAASVVHDNGDDVQDHFQVIK